MGYYYVAKKKKFEDKFYLFQHGAWVWQTSGQNCHRIYGTTLHLHRISGDKKLSCCREIVCFISLNIRQVTWRHWRLFKMTPLS